MANVKITALPQGTPKLTDQLAGVDTTGTPTTKKFLFGDQVSFIGIEVQNQTFTFGVTGGTSTAYTVSFVPAVTALQDGQLFLVQFTVANGASPTININALGPIPLVDANFTALAANAIPAANSLALVAICNSATQAMVTSQYISVPVSLAQGGTSKALVADNGAIVYCDADSFELLAHTTTAGQVLQSGNASAPSWSTATYPATTTVSQILYSSATNVVGGITTANSAVLVTNSSGVPAMSGTMTDGQLIIGGTSATPTAAALTAGAGISVTNGTGSITIASTASGLTWANIAGTSQAATVNSGYVVGNAAQTTITLPATAALGSVVAIQGKGAAGWILAANLGQTINVGEAPTSTAGSVTSAAANDAIEVVCVTANTTWSMRSAVTSGFTTA